MDINIAGLVGVTIIVVITIVLFYLKLKQWEEKGYRKGKLENRGLPMDMIHLINDYVGEDPFLAVNVCERYLAVKLSRKDDPRFTSTFFIKFDSEKDLKEVKPGQLYRINSMGKIEEHPFDPGSLDGILRKPEKQ